MPPPLSPADFLRSRPQGTSQWLETFGSSMAPFLRSGDSLLVERGAELRPGDVAVLARADGALLAHLVVSDAPLATSTFLGFPDAPGLEPLGRAVRAKVRGVEVPLGPLARQALLGAHRALRVAPARAAVPHVAALPPLRALRRAALAPDLQLLSEADTERAVRTLGDCGAPFSPDVLRGALARGLVAAALGGSRILALVALSAPGGPGAAPRLHAAGTLARGRGLGLEERTLALALAEADARGWAEPRVAAASPAFRDAIEALALRPVGT